MQPSDPRLLAEWDQQCSRHVCREQRCQVPFSKAPGEVYAGGGEGEEGNVPGGMPSEGQAILPLCCLGSLISGCGGDM